MKNNFSKKIFQKIFQLLMELPVLQNVRGLFYFIDTILLISIAKPKDIDSTNKKRVIIVFPFALGDSILFGASAEYYRKLYPKNKYILTYLVTKGCEDLFEKYGDEIISFEFTVASVNLFYRRNILKKLREKKYDIVIDPYSCVDCTPNVYMTRAIFAREKIGFEEIKKRKAQCPDWMRCRIYDRVYTIKGENLHRLIYYSKVLECLDVKLDDIKCMNIPSTQLKITLPDRYYIIFPSASMDVKKWEIDKFFDLIMRINSYYHLPLVFVGTTNDYEDVEKLKAKLEGIFVLDLLGKTNVLQLCEIIGRSQFLVTNDTSAYHIGVAKDVKTFLISGGYVFDMFAKYPYLPENNNQPIIIAKWRDCFNCDNYCIYNFKNRYPCVEDVTVEQVWGYIKSNIGEKRDD